MTKYLIMLAVILMALSPQAQAFRDLETGTFLTRDPIGYGDGPNIYCYVHCNPITGFDPLGLTEWQWLHPYGAFGNGRFDKATGVHSSSFTYWGYAIADTSERTTIDNVMSLQVSAKMNDSKNQHIISINARKGDGWTEAFKFTGDKGSPDGSLSEHLSRRSLASGLPKGSKSTGFVVESGGQPYALSGSRKSLKDVGKGGDSASTALTLPALEGNKGSIDLWFHYPDRGHKSGPAWVAQWRINWSRNKKGEMSYTITGMEGDDHDLIAETGGYEGPKGKTAQDGGRAPDELSKKSVEPVKVDSESDE